MRVSPTGRRRREAQEAVTNAPLADKARIAEQYYKYSLVQAKLLLQYESLEQS